MATATHPPLHTHTHTERDKCNSHNNLYDKREWGLQVYTQYPTPPLCPKQVTCKYLLDVLAYKITTQHTLLHDDMVKQMNR